jgi:hypothetical protein
MSHQKGDTRREWLRRAGLAAGTLSLVESCGPDQKAQRGQAGKAVVGAQYFHVLCHGMMAFDLRPAASPPTIRIYMPGVLGHAYVAAQGTNYAALQGGPYMLTGPVGIDKKPSAIDGTSNVYLTRGGNCDCTYKNADTSAFAYVDIPMPDLYVGFRPVTKSGSSFFLPGYATQQCGVNPATYYAVHAFRYSNSAASVSFAGPGGVNWTMTATDKLHLYAEPLFPMPDRLMHIRHLDDLFNYIDLQFDASNVITASPPTGDGVVVPNDTRSLGEIFSAGGRGAEPTTCLSFFVS